MPVRKRFYHFDKLQYLDASNNLLFYFSEAILNNKESVHVLTDSYNKLVVYSDLHSIQQVKDSWPQIISGFNVHFGFHKGKNPKSYPVSYRTKAISLCITLGYKTIPVGDRPTISSLADIFNISQHSLQNNKKRYEKSLILDEKFASEWSELVNFVSLHLLD